ncbi:MULTISPECIES: hypothetical protein [unclassified Mesorhizobium]|uniref:hypothetical protein n=1 Tax=unclassified Mesorhizobium TaxID=325217 RepID=UPI001CCA89C6|nr:MULTISPECIES: hypothetical protein [unclassified Mesorhizobium]MBZ9738055.1 hypothetical protein [Mesorhizobium sp. CO1-1-4]MBZ9803636.1 hypothetical protein [Mesorhizobium sp. ES1-6]
MEEAAKLLTALGDCIEVIEAYLTAAQRSTLDGLLAALPTQSPTGSATMVHRELDARRSTH